MANITAKQYAFQFEITNHPHLLNVERVISFVRQYKELNNIKYIESEFIINHFNNGVEIPELEKAIRLYSDGKGDVSYPKGLNIVNGSITCDDYTMLTDIDFYLNWMNTRKCELTLFELIIALHDIRKYNLDGTLTPVGQTAVYTFFDLKYWNINNTVGLNMLL